MDDYDSSSSIDESQIDLYKFKKELNMAYLKKELLEQELYEKNLEIENLTNDLNSYKQYFYYSLSGCVFWAYFAVVTNLLKN